MSSRLGTCLPMIFAKGQPAKLHEMPLEQLRKFLLFLIKSVTKKDLPHTLNPQDSPPPPSWWPQEFEFSRTTLYEKRPQRELIKRLTRVVSSCYSECNASYMIAFSSALSPSSANQSFGKLTYVELDDGTTRILNGKGQLVVVIRTATRYYDRKEAVGQENMQNMQRRRSARLRAPPISNDNKEILATNFCGSFVALENIDQPKPTRKTRNMPAKALAEISVQIVAQKPTSNQSNDSHIVQKKDLSRKRKKRGCNNVDEVSNKKIPCRKCGKEFLYVEFLADHESECLHPSTMVEDLRNNPAEKDFFMNFMGLVPTQPRAGSSTQTFPSAPIVEDKKSDENVNSSKPRSRRNLRTNFARTQLASIIRTHPLPITSVRGKELLEAHNQWSPFGLSTTIMVNPKNDAYRHCGSRVTKARPCPAFPVTTLKKFRLSEDAYAHVYSFSAKERRKRGVELELGIRTRAFKLLNQLKPLQVRVERLPKPKFDHYMQKIEDSKRRRREAIDRLIKRSQPVIHLIDIVKYPEALPAKYKNKMMRRQY